jgi:hypothetical protein
VNARAFVQPPWIEIDGDVFTVVVEAYHWCAHPRFGYSTHRFAHSSVEAALAHMDRLGFHVPGLTASDYAKAA